jgi:tetratricopeptide (TPR) repeat protein
MRTSGFKMVVVLGAMAALLAGCQDPGAARLREGYAALDDKRYDEAFDAAEAYLQQHPGGSALASAVYLRGRVIEQRVKSGDAASAEDLRVAEQHYRKALELSPDRVLDGYIRTSLGHVCFWLGDYASAATYCTQAVGLLDNDELKVWVLYRIGICRQRLGQWNEADGVFALIRQQYPGSEAAERCRERQGARDFRVQVAAFQSAVSADKVVASLRAQGIAAGRYERADSRLQFVMAGPVRTYAEAVALKGRLAAQYRDSIIRP